MRKKLLALSLAFGVTLSLAACGGNDNNSSNSGGNVSGNAGGNGEKITINIGHGGAESTAQQVGCLAMEEYLENTGRFTVNVYPNNSMGSDDELCQMVQNGSIEMCLANSVIVNYVPDTAVYDMYFTFDDIDAVKDKYSNNGEFIKAIGEKYTDVGIHLAGFSIHGFRDVTANKAITSPEDLAGLTFRVQQNEYHILGWESLGATPTPFAFNELYTALQQGTVDAQENPIELIYSQKFYEQQSYITLTNHQQQVQQWLVNDALYQSLSEEDRTLLDEGIQAGCDAATEYALSQEAEWTQEIQDYGCTIVELTDEQRQAFVDRIQPQWDAIKATVDPAVYEAYLA